MKTISVLNLKGGVGKTTTANNLSIGLAQKGFKVLLIDFDQQANATDIFTQEVIDKGVAHLLFHPEEVNDQVLKTNQENLDFIPSSLDLAIAERTLLVSASANHNKLQKVLRNLDKKYDYCVIDCPPVLNLLVTNALVVSDEVIIPIKIDRFALSGYKTSVQQIEAIAGDFNLDISIKVLFTMVNRNNTDKQIVEQFKQLGVEMLQTTIRQQPKPIVQASLNREVVITKNSPVGNDYKNFVEEYIKGGLNNVNHQ